VYTQRHLWHKAFFIPQLLSQVPLHAHLCKHKSPLCNTQFPITSTPPNSYATNQVAFSHLRIGFQMLI
jgi:hypothetical protein